MKHLSILITAYLMGYLVFTTAAWFGIYNEWDVYYFIWSSFFHGGAFVWWTVYIIAPKVLKKEILPVCVFAGSVSVWEIIAYCTEISINNEWAVAAVFLVLIGVFAYYLFKGFSRISKFIPYA